MGSLALTSLVIGATIGVRLPVFALIPVILLSFVVVTALGLAASETGWSIVLMNLVGATGLQFGYLAGTMPRFLIIGALREPAEHPHPVPPFTR